MYNMQRFATLWMGRWLPGESFVPPFMTYDNHKRPLAPARSYRRAFGYMFLDRTFRPQQNKCAIEPNRSLWLSLRREMDSEKIFAAYDNWLLECNKKYDHEVLFDMDLSKVCYDEDRGMSRHESIMLAGTRFKIGDKVQIARKGTKGSAACYAEIKDFWQDGHPSQGRKDGHVSLVELEAMSLHDGSEVKEMRFSHISMTKITPTKWKEESLRLSKNVVVDIAWENELLATLAARGATLEAGTVLRHQSVVCLNSDGKPTAATSKGSTGGGVANVGLGLDVILVIKTPRGKDVQLAAELRDSDARTDGAKRFEFPALLDGDETVFSVSGRYNLEFMLRRAKGKGEMPTLVVKTVSYSVTVMPGAPRSLELLNREVEVEQCPVDAPLPVLSFQLLDAFRNKVEHCNSCNILQSIVSMESPSGGNKIDVECTHSCDSGVITVSDISIGKICGNAPLGKWRLGLQVSLDATAGPCAIQPAMSRHKAPSPNEKSPGKSRQDDQAVSSELKRTPVTVQKKWVLMMCEVTPLSMVCSC